MTGRHAVPPDGVEALVAAAQQSPFALMAFEGEQLIGACANDAGRALGGRDIVGLTLREAFSDLGGQQIIDLYEQVYRTGEPVHGHQWRVHPQPPDQPGREMFATFSLAPWRFPDGRVRGVIGTGVDVTHLAVAQRRAELDAEKKTRRYESSREVVSAVQHVMLPQALPVLPTAAIAASYLPADHDTSAGGDWFDAVARPDGTIAVVVGDVVGHGITASSVMGQLRVVLSGQLADGAGLPDAMAATDRVARRLQGAYAATVCVVIFDPRTGVFEYCTAGHPPPLTITAGGRTVFAALTQAQPLATSYRFPTLYADLAVGDILVLYSDGILGRPGLMPDTACSELATVAAAAAGDTVRDPTLTAVERICDHTIEILTRAGGHSDDIAVLAFQRTEAVPPLRLQLPAVPSSLPTMRGTLAQWLRRLGADEDDIAALQHAVGEAATNAVEHAYPTNTGEYALDAYLADDGDVHVAVADRGVWRAPRDEPHRGRGLALAAQLVTNLRAVPTLHGTTVTATHRLARKAHLLTSAPTAATVAALAADDLRIQMAPGVPVFVSGAVDASTADLLRRQLVHHTRGGTVPTVVDLSDVTLLSSAAVSALYDLAGPYNDPPTVISLHAVSGSIAHHVLDVVGLPHRTDPRGTNAANTGNLADATALPRDD